MNESCEGAPVCSSDANSERGDEYYTIDKITFSTLLSKYICLQIAPLCTKPGQWQVIIVLSSSRAIVYTLSGSVTDVTWFSSRQIIRSTATASVVFLENKEKII